MIPAIAYIVYSELVYLWRHYAIFSAACVFTGFSVIVAGLMWSEARGEKRNAASQYRTVFLRSSGACVHHEHQSGSQASGQDSNLHLHGAHRADALASRSHRPDRCGALPCAPPVTLPPAHSHYNTKENV